MNNTSNMVAVDFSSIQSTQQSINDIQDQFGDKAQIVFRQDKKGNLYATKLKWGRILHFDYANDKVAKRFESMFGSGAKDVTELMHRRWFGCGPLSRVKKAVSKDVLTQKLQKLINEQTDSQPHHQSDSPTSFLEVPSPALQEDCENETLDNSGNEVDQPTNDVETQHIVKEEPQQPIVDSSNTTEETQNSIRLVVTEPDTTTSLNDNTVTSSPKRAAENRPDNRQQVRRKQFARKRYKPLDISNPKLEAANALYDTRRTAKDQLQKSAIALLSCGDDKTMNHEQVFKEADLTLSSYGQHRATVASIQKDPLKSGALTGEYIHSDNPVDLMANDASYFLPLRKDKYPQRDDIRALAFQRIGPKDSKVLACHLQQITTAHAIASYVYGQPYPATIAKYYEDLANSLSNLLMTQVNMFPTQRGSAAITSKTLAKNLQQAKLKGRRLGVDASLKVKNKEKTAPSTLNQWSDLLKSDAEIVQALLSTSKAHFTANNQSG
ncbi:hypothetical protein AB1K70_03375 [Bremerella sp. JC770]|uniref:hypothetical protein n=1 Tax=Bremerella sp. JC770 TaxID=3232137 RepID=UPI0034582BE5